LTETEILVVEDLKNLKCFKLPAAIVAKIAKSLLDHLETNRFIAAIVLRNKVVMTPEDLTLEAPDEITLKNLNLNDVPTLVTAQVSKRFVINVAVEAPVEAESVAKAPKKKARKTSTKTKK
jgi:hypothetical protein